MAKVSDIHVGDRVRWKSKRVMGVVGQGYSSGDIVGVVRSIKLEPYDYAVIAAEPYGQLYMPPLGELERAEPLKEKVGAVLEKGKADGSRNARSK